MDPFASAREEGLHIAGPGVGNTLTIVVINTQAQAIAHTIIRTETGKWQRGEPTPDGLVGRLSGEERIRYGREQEQQGESEIPQAG